MDDGAARGACGDLAVFDVSWRKARQIAVPTSRQLARLGALELRRQVGKLAGVGIKAALPVGLELLAALACLPKEPQGFVGHEKRLGCWPAEIALGRLDLLDAEWVAVRLPRSGALGAAIAQHRALPDAPRSCGFIDFVPAFPFV